MNYKGRTYPKLAPPNWMLKKSSSGELNDTEFLRVYKSEVLDKLDPHEVLNEIGNDAVLLCWEKSGELCHRRSVAEWLSLELGIEVPEIEHTKPARRRVKAKALRQTTLQ
jgi:uncharacterized protein (DUF488 family)